MEKNTEKKAPSQIEQWMIDALLNLMKQKPFRDIKITEIVDEAKLARCTFYRYYGSKEALLLRCCESVFAGLASRLQQEDCYTFYGNALGYFSYWKEHQEFLELLRNSGTLYFLMQSYTELMFEVAKSVKPENAEKGGHDFSPKVRYHFFFGMGGFWEVANRWILNGCKESPEELSQYVVAYLVESYELEPDCQYYAKHGKYPYDPCYIKPGDEI